VQAGVDARSRLIHITDTGREKRTQAQRHWKSAQLALNSALGAERVMALHTLVDDSLALLAALPEQEGSHDD
jgi:DNA-binding MarR family transcriptional regulator